MNPVSSLTTSSLLLSSLFFTDPAPTEFYTLSLHDALPIFISLLDTTSPHRLAGAGGPTGGTFQIGWVPPGGAQQLTPVLNHSATAAQVLAALQSLGAIEPGDVAVTGGPLPGAPITIHFQGQYLHRTISPPTIRNPTITPATAAIVFERGQVYTEQQINDALDAPPSVFMSWDSGGHGTHGMGIAAGAGSPAGNCHLEDYYVGVAPEADLVAVKTSWTDVQTMRGIQHVFTTADIRATQVGHDVAAVVNLSLTGEHSGARDGSTQLEKDIDIALVGDPPGRVIVKSAGNYGRLHDYAAQRQVYWTGSASHAFTAVPA